MKKNFLHQLFASSSQDNRNKINLRYLFLAMMTISLIIIFLPIRWTGPLEKFCQTWIAPAGRLSILAAKGILPSAKTSDIQKKKLADERLHRLLSAISVQLYQLKKQNRQLLKLRKIVSNSPILIPARVIGFDSLGLASIEIDKGSASDIKANLPVIADIPAELIGLDKIDPNIIIAGGTLIGTIAYQPGPYTARVKLMTSPDTKLSAFVVRLHNNKLKRIARIRIKGTKTGKRMIADMVPIKHNVKIGDLVILEQYRKFLLPTPMTIGIIEKVNIRTDNRLLSDLIVKPVIPKIMLDTVYVLVPSK